MVCAVNKSLLLGSILLALSGCGGDDSGLPEQGSLPEVPSSPTVPEPVVPPIGVVPPTDPVDPEPVEPEPVTPPIVPPVGLVPFNFIDMEAANTSGEDADVFAVKFTWRHAGSFKNGAITYHVCEKVQTEENECLSLGSVVNERHLTLNIDGAVRNINKEYFILAEQQGEVKKSNEKQISLALINNIVGYFKAHNTDALDRFGFSSAMSKDGTMLVVGAPSENSSSQGIDGEDNNALKFSGAVYVYEDTTGTGKWNQTAYIKAPTPEALMGFGEAVALNYTGDVIAVGTSSALGFVYIYEKDASGNWTFKDVLPRGVIKPEDHFGRRLAFNKDGDWLAVSADNDSSCTNEVSNTDCPGAGAVYIYLNDGTSWVESAFVKSPNVNADLPTGEKNKNGTFGASISFSDDGTYLAVGAPDDIITARGVNGELPIGNNPKNVTKGAAYIFRFQDSISIGVPGSPLSNDTVWLLDSQIYTYNDNVNSELTGGVGGRSNFDDYFGGNVILSPSGNRLFVSAEEDPSSSATTQNQDQDKNSSGAVYVFDKINDKWTRSAFIKASNSDSFDFFGSSIAVSRDTNILVVGANNEDSSGDGIQSNDMGNSVSDSGAVYTYEYDGVSWNESLYIKPPVSDDSRRFGTTVQVSEDGQRLSVTAVGDKSSSDGINGDENGVSAFNSGALFLY